MAAKQLDVFVNPDPEFSDTHPYFVVLQHDALGHLNTRVVAPLVAPKAIPFFDRLMPEVSIGGARYVVDMTNIGVIPVRLLQERVANLEERRYDVVRAIDLIFTGV
jgi:toxin CcdB